jgi:hypothetical protein
MTWRWIWVLRKHFTDDNLKYDKKSYRNLKSIAKTYILIAKSVFSAKIGFRTQKLTKNYQKNK